MVTASHNPKADNGFKVYWGNGCQIIPPHDDGIAAAIMDNLEPATQYKYSGDDWAFTAEAAAATGKLQTGAAVLEALVSAYMTAISSLRFDGAAAAAVGADAVMATYTAMHGVGRPWVERAVQTFGIPRDSVSVVAVQADPDPEFPTVVFPNPEEKGALNCAQEWAVQHDCGLIVANDPDADRLAVAEFQKGDGKWHVFHGNEIGAMLGYWAIKKYLKAGGAAGEAAVIASVVSSRMLRAIARKEGIQYYDTLTGFKWIGNKAVELAGSGTSVLFGYEEALGYAYGDVVFDKDGVSAAAVLLEMAAVLRKNDDRGLLQQLNYLRAQYGDFVSYNYYIICHDGIVTDTCFADMRTGGAGGGYKLAFAGVKVTSIQDVTMGYDSTTSDKKLDMPATPGSHMVMYEFENGVSFTLRTSGTEPKIKWYTEVAAKTGAPRDSATNDLKAFVDAAIQEMLQCEKYGLK